MSNLKDIIKQLAGTDGNVLSYIAEVVTVNDAERSCTVTLLAHDLQVEGIRLQASLDLNEGLYLKPKVGSFVIVSQLSKATFYVTVCSELDEIQLNGSNHGGVIIASRLKDQVDKNSDFLDKIKQLFNSWTPVPQDGGAALKAAWSVIQAALQTADLTDITNDKVKHGG